MILKTLNIFRVSIFFLIVFRIKRSFRAEKFYSSLIMVSGRDAEAQKVFADVWFR